MTGEPRTWRWREPRSIAMVRRRYAGSAADHLWRRLNALDFINRGLHSAAVLLLCLVPFLIVIQALAGRSAASGVIRRFGLDPAAARAVTEVFTSPSATRSAVTGLSWVFFALSGLSVAAAIQELYERTFGLESRGFKDTPRRVAWLAVAIATCGAVQWAQPVLHRVGGALLVALVALVGATLFWWFSMWLLLGGRMGWRTLLPASLATGVCWFGMTIVFRLTMSQTIVSNYTTYGPIGVVFAIMSFLIAIGVVLIVGAIFGVVWEERHSSRVP
ncbi:MAG: YhjD/YihY/BrkB family envelope integrity protein [Frankiaceae bacterium]